LSDLRADPQIRFHGEVEVGFDVENAGERPGKTVVQVYLERIEPGLVDRPVRWLAGHRVVRAGAGERTRASVPIGWRRFAHWAEGWSVEPGRYRLRVGFSVVDLRLESDVSVIETNH
jgi:beta-glucosidase